MSRIGALLVLAALLSAIPGCSGPQGDLRMRYSVPENGGLLRGVATRGAFFCVALVTPEPAGDDVLGTVSEGAVRAITLDQEIEREDGEPSRQAMLAEIRCRVPLEGGSARGRYTLYAGPNETSALRDLQIEDTVDFGWFGLIGRALMALMKLLQGIVGSYGFAIILMTMVVRAVLLPISYRAQLGMQRYSKRIQKIKPLLDEVQKKFAGKPDKLNQERMRLMREHKVGLPLGCLMLFFQLPIWISLFAALRVEFALRHQSFLWADDLSMPDQLLTLGFWPGQLNLLPILMLVLWVLQQKLAPTPGSDDPQVKMQMKMMRFMPYMFFFMLYKYAAALSVYMCISSAWSIAESKLVRKAIAKSD